MKLIRFSVLAMVVFCISSCTKDRTCSCSNGFVRTVMNSTKMEANKTCEEFMFDQQKAYSNKKITCDID